MSHFCNFHVGLCYCYCTAADSWLEIGPICDSGLSRTSAVHDAARVWETSFRKHPAVTVMSFRSRLPHFWTQPKQCHQNFRSISHELSELKTKQTFRLLLFFLLVNGILLLSLLMRCLELRPDIHGTCILFACVCDVFIYICRRHKKLNVVFRKCCWHQQFLNWVCVGLLLCCPRILGGHSKCCTPSVCISVSPPVSPVPPV